MDAASNTTTYTYDELGRRIAVTDALSNTTHTAYDAEGRVLATWGATYPVAYDYDDAGRMTAMYTLRDSSLVISNYSSFIIHTSSFDRTTWLYDLAPVC
jgi:YD repeat-containing protein